MRNLASIQKIKVLDPIPGKDKIVYAGFENVGWRVIADKSLSVGDLCVYIEYDSILPVKPEFEFLRPRCFSPKWKGFVIRNMKMGDLYSQGIVFPLTILPVPQTPYKEGQDVTEILGIRKYDLEELLEETDYKEEKHGSLFTYLLRYKWFRNIFYPYSRSGNFPDYLPKTDETRVQVLLPLLTSEWGKLFYITEKMDGTSFSSVYKNGSYIVCSRKRAYSKNNSVYWKAFEKFNIKKALKILSKEYSCNIAIQGEICGPGIQSNKYNLTEIKLFIYNIYNITDKEYFGLYEIERACSLTGLEMVPVINRMFTLDDTVETLLEKSKGKSVYGDTPREGIVVRPIIARKGEGRTGPVFGFKVINPDFDLMYNKRKEKDDE